MGESAVALRYAEALFALGREEGQSDAILEDLVYLKATLDHDPGNLRKLMDPRMDLADKERLANDALLGGRHPYVQNLVRLLIRRRRESVLADLFRQYLEVHDREQGILRVRVETATDMEPSVADTVRDRLQDATGKTVTLETATVPGLLGGMRFLVGSRLIDGSTKSRLERIDKGLRAVALEAN